MPQTHINTHASTDTNTSKIGTTAMAVAVKIESITMVTKAAIKVTAALAITVTIAVKT